MSVTKPQNKIKIPRPLGKNMLNALEFIKLCNGWHTFVSTNRAAKEAIMRLEKRGLVEVNEFNQFRLAKKFNEFLQLTK